ncbi:sortase [Nocardioides panacisoli]|uniref:Sortase n=1 Tax=Nocardioides panacisoli TaxID=627624 RepID=A0ABP7IGW8_9ACTN
MAATVTEPDTQVAPPGTPAPTPGATPPRQRRRLRLRKEQGSRRAEPRPQKPWEWNVATVVATGMILVFAALALFGGYLFGGSALAQHRQQDIAFAQLKKDLALATVPVGGAIAPGTPVGIVTIPRLGVEQVFEMGSNSEQTLDGPGLRPDTVLPGQAGVSVLIGRRATAGAPFRHLDQLQPGDTIKVVTGQGKFTYVVDVVRTSDAPDRQIVAAESRLTLVTSDPAITNTRTLTVSATLDGKALPASTGLAGGASADTSDQAGKGVSDHAIALLLWAQALLITSVAATWATVRLRWRAVWIGAVPALLAVLWHVFENITLLLPNTL